MALFFAASVDFVHALLMALWVIGLPLLFWHRFPRLTNAYAFYAIGFVVVNQASEFFLGECMLTTLAGALWEQASRSGGPLVDTSEWFTVRLAVAIFRLTPSHRVIKLISEALILITALGVAYRVVRRRACRAADRCTDRNTPGESRASSGDDFTRRQWRAPANL